MKEKIVFFFIMIGCAAPSGYKDPDPIFRIKMLEDEQKIILKDIEALKKKIALLEDQLEIQKGSLWEDNEVRRLPIVRLDPQQEEIKEEEPLKIKKGPPPIKKKKKPKIISQDLSSKKELLKAIRLYQNAYTLYTKGMLKEAIFAFQRFIKEYPLHRKIADAIFWKGECYYELNDFSNAISNFSDLLKNYPLAKRAADAMLKIGFSYLRQGNIKKAKIFLLNVSKRYPKTKAATIALQRLEEIKHAKD
jgi:tol-pal system protein YbgF